MNRPQEGDGDSVSVVESGTPASQPDVELADSQSDTDASEDARVPAVLSHRVLLEDPLILNSPQVSIPKKCGPVYKTQNWPLPTDYPCVSLTKKKKKNALEAQMMAVYAAMLLTECKRQ